MNPITAINLRIALSLKTSGTTAISNQCIETNAAEFGALWEPSRNIHRMIIALLMKLHLKAWICKTTRKDFLHRSLHDTLHCERSHGQVVVKTSAKLQFRCLRSWWR